VYKNFYKCFFQHQKIALGMKILDIYEVFGFSVTQKASEIGNPLTATIQLLHSHVEAQYLRSSKG